MTVDVATLGEAMLRIWTQELTHPELPGIAIRVLAYISLS